MIGLALFSLIGHPTQKMAQLGPHQLRQILADALAHFHPHHLQDPFRLSLNLLENIFELCYAKRDFHGLFLLS
jgi:hypothetical protein